MNGHALKRWLVRDAESNAASYPAGRTEFAVRCWIERN